MHEAVQVANSDMQRPLDHTSSTYGCAATTRIIQHVLRRASLSQNRTRVELIGRRQPKTFGASVCSAHVLFFFLFI
jgi:hypothetical protein